MKGKRAVEWRLSTQSFRPASSAIAWQSGAGNLRRFRSAGQRVRASRSGRSTETIEPGRWQYSSVDVDFDRQKRVADLTIAGPDAPEPTDPDGILAAGDQFWPLRAFRELDDALLRLRMNEPLIGTMIFATTGHAARCSPIDRTLLAHQEHWLVREIVHFIKRTLKRLDLTARSFFALIEPGSCWAGTFFELALAADRAYMLDDPDRPVAIALSPMNGGLLTMSNGLTRLETRFIGEPAQSRSCSATTAPFDPAGSPRCRLWSSFAPDELDWEDEIRLAIESARGPLARRADRNGSEPAICGSGNDGDEDLRPPDARGRTGSSSARTPSARRGALTAYGTRGPAGVRFRRRTLSS